MKYLGCGSGAWILHAAQVWKQTHFTGLDIVPLHPDLTRVGPSDLANRVSWVQANFLHRLPFPENEFDFVFLKRVFRAVPEDKINVLFDEILRVMKPGGVIEILDEDLHFPGTMPDPRVVEADSASSDASSSSVNLLSVSTSLSSTSAASQSRASPVSRSSMSSPSYGHSKKKSEPGEFHARLLDADRGVAGMPQASASTSELGQVQSHWGASKAKNGEDVPASMTGSRMPKREGSGAILGSGMSPQHLDASAPSSFQSKATETRRRSLSNARAGKQSSADAPPDPSPSLSSAILRRKSQNRNPTQSRDMDPVSHSHSESMNSRRMDSQERAEKPTLSTPPARAVPQDSGFVLTHVGGSSHELTLDETGGNVNRTGTVNKGKNTSGSSNGTDAARDGVNTGPAARKTSDARMSKVLYHPSLGQPLNPRDHSLLKRIYKEMHEARFINLTPLSVLGAQLDMYFSRVKSCAPIVFGFPPRLQTRHELGHADADDGQDDPFLPTLDNDLYETSILQFQNNTIVHAKSGVPRKDSGRRSLSRGDEAASPYIIIDNARAPALPAPRIKPRPSYPESVCSGTSNETETTPSDGSRPSLSLPFSAEAAEPPAPPPQAPAEPPEAMLEIDLKSLPMMLSSCVVDTLACAEAMWDWVLEEQARHAAVKTQNRAREPHPLAGGDEDVQMKMIREITRADFDACLSRFEMDMHDNIALSDAMEQYLHLRPNFSPSRSAERKSFDTACAAWDAGHALDQGAEGAPVSANGGAHDGSRPAVAADAAAGAGAVRLSRTIRIFTGVKGS
ncbi:hypothetical protein DFH11DRAFT_215262 [Phellopilus nigrolimitatus]|nr:hypothetical protein DFH11DRAFT_215262 [Phellopilus nigrolimitatus]